MGASNAIAAYQLYAGRVPPISMQLLGYMALVSRDHDEHPWFSLGHQALAVHALGRPAPPTRADVKAVERAVTPLLAVGAIVTDRRAAVRRDGSSTARYRLQLVHGEHRHIDDLPVDNPVDNPAGGHSGGASRPPEFGPHVPRNSGSRPPDSVPTSPGIRGTEEKEEKEERVKENHLDLESTSPLSTGTAPPEPQKPKLIDDGCCPGCGVLLDPGRLCGNRSCAHYGAQLATVHPLPAA
jgi:hypothetical protein